MWFCVFFPSEKEAKEPPPLPFRVSLTWLDRAINSREEGGVGQGVGIRMKGSRGNATDRAYSSISFLLDKETVESSLLPFLNSMA